MAMTEGATRSAAAKRGDRRRWSMRVVATAAAVLAAVSGSARAEIGEVAADEAFTVAPTTGPVDQPWPSFVLGYLPVAMAAAITIGAAQPVPTGDCRPAARCGQRKSTGSSFFADWNLPYGPIAGDGWVLFAAVADKRYYAYPIPAKDRPRAWADSWSWGGGAQLDLLPIIGSDRSNGDLFLIGELGGGFDHTVDERPYQTRARLVLGRGGSKGMIFAVGEFGTGSEAPESPLPTGVSARLGLEIRF